MGKMTILVRRVPQTPTCRDADVVGEADGQNWSLQHSLYHYCARESPNCQVIKIVLKLACEAPLHRLSNSATLRKKFQFRTLLSRPANKTLHPSNTPTYKMAAIQITATLPTLPDGWTAEKDFKPVGHLSEPTQRALEPVGPHYLAHARRKRHRRTFSEVHPNTPTHMSERPLTHSLNRTRSCRQSRM